MRVERLFGCLRLEGKGRQSLGVVFPELEDRLAFSLIREERRPFTMSASPMHELVARVGNTQRRTVVLCDPPLSPARIRRRLNAPPPTSSGRPPPTLAPSPVFCIYVPYPVPWSHRIPGIQYVVTEPESTPSGHQPPAASNPRGGQSSSEPLSLTSDNDEENSDGSVGGSSRIARGGEDIPDSTANGAGSARKKRQRRTQSDIQPVSRKEEGMNGGATPLSKGPEATSRSGIGTAAVATGDAGEPAVAAAAEAKEVGADATPMRAGSKRKAAAAASASIALGAKSANGRARKGKNRGGVASDGRVADGSGADGVATDTAETDNRGKGKEDAFLSVDGSSNAIDPAAGTGADRGGAGLPTNGGMSGSRKRMRHGRDKNAHAAPAAGGGGGSTADGAGVAVAAAVSSSAPGAGAVRDRWVHVDPVQGAVDQAHKVSNGDGGGGGGLAWAEDRSSSRRSTISVCVCVWCLAGLVPIGLLFLCYFSKACCFCCCFVGVSIFLRVVCDRGEMEVARFRDGLCKSRWIISGRVGRAEVCNKLSLVFMHVSVSVLSSPSFPLSLCLFDDILMPLWVVYLCAFTRRYILCALCLSLRSVSVSSLC